MPEKPPSLAAAYALDGNQDVKSLYAGWARTYDTDFIGAMGYLLPAAVSRHLQEETGGRVSRLLDVGCGSGAVGACLPGYRIDGLDLSPEMLQVAVEKGAYTRLIEGDLLATLPIESACYDAIVSAGTFTHGHVGPEAIDELLRVATGAAVFVLAINAEHFDAKGFRQALENLEASGRITAPVLHDTAIYDATHDHSADRAVIAVFRAVRRVG